MRFLAFALLLALAAPASADQALSGRYRFVPVESGALRLDRETGEIYLCTVAGGGYSCSRLAGGAPGARDILRLQTEVAALSTRVEQLEARQAAPAGLSALDRVGVLADRVMRHFVGAIEDVKRKIEAL